MFVALPVALLAVAGTSAPESPAAVTAVEEVDGAVVIDGTIELHRSATGLGDWVPLTDAERAAIGGFYWKNRRQTQACAPDQPEHCYRVHGRDLPAESTTSRGRAAPAGGRLLGVDESTDNGRTWRTAWEIPKGRWLFLANEHGIFRPRDDFLLASRDIVVRTVPGGHQVIVANGVDGLAVRDPDGTWHRVGVETTTPSPLQIRPAALTGFGRAIAWEVALGVLVGMVGLLISSLVVGWRIRRLGMLQAVLWPVVAVSAIFLSLPGADAVAFLESTVAGLLFAGGMLVLAVTAALVQRGMPRSRALAVVGGGLLVMAAFVAPYLGWTLGRPVEYPAATVLAWSLAGAALLVTIPVAWWTGAAARLPAPHTDPLWPAAPGPVRGERR